MMTQIYRIGSYMRIRLTRIDNFNNQTCIEMTISLVGWLVGRRLESR